jgi:hypothetical protein
VQLDQSSFYRNVIIPWYDSNALCLGTILFLGSVLAFAGVGVWVAMTQGDYAALIWSPVTLAGLSGFVMIKTVLRLINRSRQG